jgi:glycine cleavage system H protein
MDTIYSAIESIGVFIAGMTIRFGLLLVVLAVLSVPVFLFLSGLKGFEAIRRRALGVVRVGGLFWRDRTYYAPGHTWLRRTGLRRVTVGLDDLAQRMFPGPSGISLVAPGTVVREGDRIGVIRNSGRQADIVAPIAGTISAVNDSVRHDPALLHRDPYERGWLFAMVPTDASLGRCRTGDAARTWMREEGARLSRFFEAELGVAAADGGEFVVPPPTLLQDEQWVRLTHEFLANQ